MCSGDGMGIGRTMFAELTRLAVVRLDCRSLSILRRYFARGVGCAKTVKKWRQCAPPHNSHCSFLDDFVLAHLEH
jgi:hypothetical protein